MTHLTTMAPVRGGGGRGKDHARRRGCVAQSTAALHAPARQGRLRSRS